MRRMLRIFFWIGLSLSSLLLTATVFCWIRSLGHEERWYFRRFAPDPNVQSNSAVNVGILRRWDIVLIHGKFEFSAQNYWRWSRPDTLYGYEYYEISVTDAESRFDGMFTPRNWQQSGDWWAWNGAGVGLHHQGGAFDPVIGQMQNESFWIAIPFWMLTLIFGTWPFSFAAWRWLRRKNRPAPGHCLDCGYDLRATPDPLGPRLSRCPECGTPTARADT